MTDDSSATRNQDPAPRPARSFRSGCVAGALAVIVLLALAAVISARVLGVQHFAIRTGSMSMSVGEPNRFEPISGMEPMTSTPLTSTPLTSAPLTSTGGLTEPFPVAPTEPKSGGTDSDSGAGTEAGDEAVKGAAAKTGKTKMVLDPPTVGQWSIYCDEEWTDGERVKTEWELWWITGVKGSAAQVRTQELDAEGRGLEEILSQEKDPFPTVMELSFTELTIDHDKRARMEPVKVKVGAQTLECYASTRALERGFVHDVSMAPGPVHFSLLRFGRIVSTSFDEQGRIKKRMRLVDFGKTGGGPRPLAPGLKAKSGK